MFFLYFLIFCMFISIPAGTILFSWVHNLNIDMTIQLLVFIFLAFFLFFIGFSRTRRFILILSTFAVIIVGGLHLSYNFVLDELTMTNENGATRLKPTYEDRAFLIAKEMFLKQKGYYGYSDDNKDYNTAYSYYNSAIDDYGMFFTKTLGGLACLNNPWSDLCDIWTRKLYNKILKSARYHKWLRDENNELSEKVQRWSK